MAGSHDNDESWRLLLSRDARLAALAKIEPDKHPSAAGLSARAWALVRLLCEQIELATTRDGCILHVETLAAKCRMSRRTFFRSAAQGRHAGVLDSSKENDERGRAPSRWWVCWDRLSVWAGVSGPEIGTIDVVAASFIDRTRDVDRDDGVDRGECQIGAAARAPTGTYLSPVALTSSKLAPTSPVLAPTYHSLNSSAEGGALRTTKTSSLPPRANSASEWRRLEDILFRRKLEGGCEVDRAADAIRIAREQGCTPEHVAELIAYWRDCGGGEAHAAWQPHGLCWRIQNARPHLAPERGWPKPSAAWLEHAAARARAEREAVASVDYERAYEDTLARARSRPVDDAQVEQFKRRLAQRGGA